jgi:integrase
MSFKKRGKVYHIDVTTPSGERIRRSVKTESKEQAEEFHDRLKAEAWRVQKLGERPKRLWEDAVVRWLKETSHKASHEGDKGKLRWLDAHLAGMELTNINRAVIDRIVDAKRAEGVSNATVNRHLALVRAILRRCHREWEWLDRAPAVRLLKEPTLRMRFLTRDQAAALLKELPEHLKDMAVFSLATGLRAANVTGLTWEQVDLNRKMAFIRAEQAKARRPIPVPFNDAAMEVVQRQKGKHFVKVFTFEGEPVKQVNTKAWKKALKRAGIEDFRWHDLRHTWASWHVQNGTPLHVLQELGGWQSAAMVRRYAHFGVEHLAAYVGRAAPCVASTEARSAKVEAEHSEATCPAKLEERSGKQGTNTAHSAQAVRPREQRRDSNSWKTQGF